MLRRTSYEIFSLDFKGTILIEDYSALPWNQLNRTMGFGLLMIFYGSLALNNLQRSLRVIFDGCVLAGCSLFSGQIKFQYLIRVIDWR